MKMLRHNIRVGKVVPFGVTRTGQCKVNCGKMHPVGKMQRLVHPVQCYDQELYVVVSAQCMPRVFIDRDAPGVKSCIASTDPEILLHTDASILPKCNNPLLLR